MRRSVERWGVLSRAVIVALLLSACGRGQSDDRPGGTQPPAAVTIATATLKSVTPSGTFVGRAQAVNTVNLLSRVSGFLQKRAFTEGQQVKTGDLLFVIEQDTYQAQVDQEKAALAKAQATEQNAALTLQRSQELVKTNAVPQATVDQDVANQRAAEADVRAAEASLRQAEINLAFTEITSPIDGRIGMAAVSVGNFVSPTSGTLATIVTQDPIYVLFPASMRDVLAYRQRVAGQPDAAKNVVVRVKLPNDQDYPHPGTVDFLDIQANQGADTLTVRAQVPNPDGWLVSGQIVNLTVEAGEPRQALMIPQAALQVDQAGSYVLIVDHDDKVQQARVKLSQSEGPDIIVQEGLQPGDRVIVQGIQNVRPGQVVAPTVAAQITP
jgi:membrane fusion protein (multidrug efflux system)